MSTVIFSGDKITEFPADVVTSEDHSLTGTVSSFAMESGVIKSDHVVLNPDEVVISFELSNNEDNGDELGTRAGLLFDTLRAARKSRSFFDVLTKHRLYENMVISDIQANHSGPFTGRLICAVTFKEFPIVVLAETVVPEGILKSEINKTASSEVDDGRVDAPEANVSLLKQGLNAIGFG